MNYYFEVLKKYAVLSGRASRKEYWTFTLINFAVAIVAGATMAKLQNTVYSALSGNGSVNLDLWLTVSMIAAIIVAIYALIMLIPSICVAVRRLHDTNRSGWWSLIIFAQVVLGLSKSFFNSGGFLYFLGFISVVVSIVWLVFTLRDSQPGENKYGPNPKEAQKLKTA